METELYLEEIEAWPRSLRILAYIQCVKCTNYIKCKACNAIKNVTIAFELSNNVFGHNCYRKSSLKQTLHVSHRREEQWHNKRITVSGSVPQKVASTSRHVEIIAYVMQEFKMNLTYLMETQHS